MWLLCHILFCNLEGLKGCLDNFEHLILDQSVAAACRGNGGSGKRFFVIVGQASAGFLKDQKACGIIPGR